MGNKTIEFRQVGRIVIGFHPENLEAKLLQDYVEDLFSYVKGVRMIDALELTAKRYEEIVEQLAICQSYTNGSFLLVAATQKNHIDFNDWSVSKITHWALLNKTQNPIYSNEEFFLERPDLFDDVWDDQTYQKSPDGNIELRFFISI